MKVGLVKTNLSSSAPTHIKR